MRYLAVTVALVIGTALLPPAARAEGDVKKGRGIAVKHCARCHVVPDHNPHGGIGSTPSFMWLANKRPDYLERMRTFYERRPHPVYVRVPGVARWSKAPPYAAEFTMTLEDIDDLVAYVETLKKK